MLTSSSQFQFCAGLGRFLIVPNKALIHSSIVFLNGFYPQYGFRVFDLFSILKPTDGFNRIPFKVACEYGGSAEVYSLCGRIDFGRKWCSYGQNGFDAFSSDGVIDDAQIFPAVLYFCFLDDKSAADLLDPVV